MATLRSTLPDVFEDRQAELFFKRFDMEPMTYPRYVRVKPVTKGHDDAFKVSGFGPFVIKPEGTPISFRDPVQGPRRRAIVSTFGLGYRVSMEAEEDAQYEVIDQMPGDLADSGRDSQENLAAGPHNDAFAGNTFTGLDGLSLCNTAHTTLNFAGGTLSNQLAPGVGLSITGLEAAVTNLRMTQDENGRRTPLNPSVLVHHPNDSHEAARLLESEFEPNTTENQINVMRSSRTGISPVDNPYQTDTDAWFLQIENGRIGVVYLDRKALTFDNGVDSITKDRLFDAHYRANMVVRDWRGIVGSNPA